MAIPRLPYDQPHSRLPEWHSKLKAKSFADGQIKFKIYIDNAQKAIAKAGIDPRNPDHFYETKYSSAAGQYGYLAAMMLIDCFLATYLKHKPLNSLLQTSEPAPGTWILLQERGLNGKTSYDTLLKMAFGKNALKYFNRIHSILHVDVHYVHNPLIAAYEDGYEILLAFQKVFNEKARELLAEHGISNVGAV